MPLVCPRAKELNSNENLRQKNEPLWGKARDVNPPVVGSDIDGRA